MFDALHDLVDRLRGGESTTPDDLRGLWRRLPVAARLALAQLSVFAGRPSTAEIDAILDLSGVDGAPDDALLALTAAGITLPLSGSVLDFARNKLEDLDAVTTGDGVPATGPGAAMDLRLRHLEHYVALGSGAAIRAARAPGPAGERLEAAAADLVAALITALDFDLVEEAAGLARAAAATLPDPGDAEVVLTAALLRDPHLQAPLLTARSAARRALGRDDDARIDLELAIRTAPQGSWALFEALALRADAAVAVGAIADARQALLELDRLADALRDDEATAEVARLRAVLGAEPT